MRKLILLSVVLTLTLASMAEGQSVEITPFGSYRYGGEIESQDSPIFDEDADIDESAAFGVFVDVPLTRGLFFEFLAARQSSEFVLDRGLFGTDDSIVDVDVDYYHIGLLYQWGHGQIHPYIASSLGVGRLDIDAPDASTEENFSMSFGGGIKIMASEHVGIRIEHRLFWTDTNSGNYRSRYDDDNDFCYDDGEWDEDCWDFDYIDDLVQGEVSVGLVLSF